MSSPLFQSYDRTLRRQFMSNLLADRARLAQPQVLSIVGAINRLYRPSNELIATAAPATIVIRATPTKPRPRPDLQAAHRNAAAQ